VDDVLSRLRSALAGRYTLERELGRGGMATVWLAEEQHPRRHVALKVLDPAIAQALGPDRFLREVDLAASAWTAFWLPDLRLRGLTHAFAHQRLVVLYARMSRLEDARRHWKIFSETFTNPDPEVRHLIDEAREALAEVERRGG